MNRFVKMTGVLLLAAGATLAIAPAQAGWVATRTVVIHDAPPPPRHEVRPHRPYPHAAWRAGHWARRGDAWVWRSGYWTRPPHQGRVWVDGYWRHSPHGWVWVDGRWR